MQIIQLIPIKKLTLLERNPRTISKEQFAKLCQSLEDDPHFFHNRPCLVNDVNGVLNVYAGNQRVRAAQKLNWKEVPCIVDRDLSEEVIKQRIIKDNKQYGEFDFDILANEYEVDLLLNAGFLEQELLFPGVQEVLNEEPEDEEEVEVDEKKEAITQLGDLYELGPHRLICGDSTEPDTVQKLLDGAEPILMVTDPPYGVNYDASWRNKSLKKGSRTLGKVENDDKINWGLAWSLFPGSAAYIWHAAWFSSEVHKSLCDAEFDIISQLIWSKQHFSLSRGDYHWKHEPCWYAVKKGHKHNWQGARDQHTIWEISNLCAFGKSKDEDTRTEHSTQKPLECMVRPIRNNTAKGEGVYDPFLGSGTTLIAAEKLDRICYGVELSPTYCDVIVNRWVAHRQKHALPCEFKRNGIAMESLQKDI